MQAVYLQNQRVQTSEGSKPHLHSTTLACTKPHTHSCTTDDKLVSRKLCSVSDGTSINPNVINTSTDQTPLDVQLNTKCEPNTLLDSTHEDLHSIVVEQKNCVSGLNETDKEEELKNAMKHAVNSSLGFKVNIKLEEGVTTPDHKLKPTLEYKRRLLKHQQWVQQLTL